MSKRIIREIKIIPCGCGCGETLINRDSKDRLRRYIQYHNIKNLIFKRKKPYPSSAVKGKLLSEFISPKINEIRKKKISKTLRLKYKLGLRVSATKGKIPWNKGKSNNIIFTPELREKLSASKRGEKSYLWRGGRNYKYGRISNYIWRGIAKTIYERDKFKCQICGNHCQSNQIQCHHIVPYLISKDDSPNNLITLCKSCHKRIDNLILSYQNKFGDKYLQNYCKEIIIK
jgi:5-methylcytosine-specific restriction endonuclease McrA